MRYKRITGLCLALLLMVAPVHAAAADETEPIPQPLTAQQVYEGAQAAVFYIRVLKPDGSLKTTGTGFLITEDGYALTASHVLKDAASVSVIPADGVELENIEIVAIDSGTDVALLKLPACEDGWPTIPVAERESTYGEPLYSIGYPLKTVKLFTSGIAACPVGSINGTDRLLFTTPLSSGMSGGPVLNEYGEAAGINSGTLRTMNGISTSPTNGQIQALLTTAFEEVTR